ncbi:unnamed protein product, partial [Ixodes hexagonus]
FQGSRFTGDLLKDGKIKWRETQEIYSSPSSWAVHCKKLLNPDKKSGCGWSTVSRPANPPPPYPHTHTHTHTHTHPSQFGVENKSCGVRRLALSAMSVVLPLLHSYAFSVSFPLRRALRSPRCAAAPPTSAGCVAVPSPERWRRVPALGRLGQLALGARRAESKTSNAVACFSRLSGAPEIRRAVARFAPEMAEITNIVTSVRPSLSLKPAKLLAPRSYSLPPTVSPVRLKFVLHAHQPSKTRSAENSDPTNTGARATEQPLKRLEKRREPQRWSGEEMNSANGDICAAVCSGSSTNSADLNTLVISTPFSVLDRIQPFTLTISTNCLLLIDFHCHLTESEVVGYLGGTWDIAAHNLSILQAFPCRARLADKEAAPGIEEEIRESLEQRHLTVVGWYHSHPRAPPQPSLRDCNCQLDYQITMKGESDSSYTPCVGLICSPYVKDESCVDAKYLAYWVMPPPEHRPNEYGKPMQMMYNVAQDSFLTQDLLMEMRLLSEYYRGSPDSLNFLKDFEPHSISYWEKLKRSLTSKLPRDLQVTTGDTQGQAVDHFWEFVKGLIMPV